MRTDIATQNAILVSNKIMEIIWRDNRSSNGISMREREELAYFWKLLSPLGLELITKWAKDNNYKIRSN